MRGQVCRVEDYALMMLFRFSREIARTSVWMGLATVLVLFWLTGAFERNATSANFSTAGKRHSVQWSPPSSALLATSEVAPKLRRLGRGPVGLQLYSLRNEFKRAGVTATLARIKAMGFRYVEIGGSYGLTPLAFKAELDRAGLQAVSMMTSYDNLRDKLGEVTAEAKIYGVSFVGTAWIPHQKPFNESHAKQAALVFNQAGAVLKAAGLKFFYHLHGYEFQPTAAGTLFDLLLKECKPTLVNFELDVFWATHGGQDAARMLQQNPARYLLMHLKDLRRDVTGNLTGSAPDDTSVVLGQGKVNWPEVLRAAQSANVQWYFIEAEELEAAANIPQSLAYLSKLKF